jgi:hypothetical protein
MRDEGFGAEITRHLVVCQRIALRAGSPAERLHPWLQYFCECRKSTVKFLNVKRQLLQVAT